MKRTAAERYAQLSADRQIFLDTAWTCAELSIPHLLPRSGTANGQRLMTPWQTMGAKGVNVMASKLLLSLFPVNTGFFKLQINDGEFIKNPELDAKIKSEIDLSLARTERVITQSITESLDRVAILQGLKHLVCTGNVLMFLGKKGIKTYPLDRYVVVRDGEGNATEIICVEAVNRQFLPKGFQEVNKTDADNHTGQEGPSPSTDVTVGEDEVAVYTHAKLVDDKWIWRQEADGLIVPNTQGTSNRDTCPFLPLRFNVVDGEDYGRGRIEEYLGDLKSLEGLMQAMVEGSAAAAKVVFLVSPAATVKPSDLARARNGAMIQGRAEDVAVVQVQKQADFSTAYQMITQLTQRLSEAFLILSVRQSERTTAEEIRATQQELNEQLGGIYSVLTAELVQPYLRRKLYTLERAKQIPKLPKGVIFPTIVAGIEGVGRGQDREALLRFTQTAMQMLGNEAVRYLNMEEFIKRLAASEGIDALNLVKTQEQQAADSQQAQQQQMTQELLGQAGQLASSPMMDPSKNPQAMAMLMGGGQAPAQPPQTQPNV